MILIRVLSKACLSHPLPFRYHSRWSSSWHQSTTSSHCVLSLKIQRTLNLIKLFRLPLGVLTKYTSCEPMRPTLWMQLLLRILDLVSIHEECCHYWLIKLGTYILVISQNYPLMFSRTSYSHILLQQLSISTINIMWGLAKTSPFFSTLNTKFLLDGSFWHLSELDQGYAIRNAGKFLFIFLAYMVQRKKGSYMFPVCQIVRSLGQGEHYEYNFKICNSIFYHRVHSQEK